MTDKIEWHLVEDGSLYAVEITSPDVEVNGSSYKVDLVRATLDDSGLEREQRLVLGQYPSWSEAEEHQREVEKGLDEKGLAGLADAASLIAEQPYQDTISYVYGLDAPPLNPDRYTFEPEVPIDDWMDAAMVEDWKRESAEPSLMPITKPDFGGSEEQIALMETQIDPVIWDNGFDWVETAPMDVIRDASPELPFAFGTDMTPYDTEGNPLVHHVDAGATVHWVGIAENAKEAAEPYQLRYYRALVSEERMLRHDSYAVMPLLDNDPSTAWPLPGLEMHLKAGDIFMVQQLAHDVAVNYGHDFPEPESLPALDSHPDYHFGYGVGPNNMASLDAVKTWMNGTERRFDTLTIAEFETWDGSEGDEVKLWQVFIILCSSTMRLQCKQQRQQIHRQAAFRNRCE